MLLIMSKFNRLNIIMVMKNRINYGWQGSYRFLRGLVVFFSFIYFFCYSCFFLIFYLAWKNLHILTLFWFFRTINRYSLFTGVLTIEGRWPDNQTRYRRNDQTRRPNDLMTGLMSNDWSSNRPNVTIWWPDNRTTCQPHITRWID